MLIKQLTHFTFSFFVLSPCYHELFHRLYIVIYKYLSKWSAYMDHKPYNKAFELSLFRRPILPEKRQVFNTNFVVSFYNGTKFHGPITAQGSMFTSKLRGVPKMLRKVLWQQLLWLWTDFQNYFFTWKLCHNMFRSGTFTRGFQQRCVNFTYFLWHPASTCLK